MAAESSRPIFNCTISRIVLAHAIFSSHRGRLCTTLHGQHVNFHDIVMNDCGYRIGHHVTFNFGSATELYTQFTQCSECAGPTWTGIPPSHCSLCTAPFYMGLGTSPNLGPTGPTATNQESSRSWTWRNAATLWWVHPAWYVASLEGRGNAPTWRCLC